MLDNIDILKLASAMVRHAAQRHAVLSENIANADTVGYKARDLESFDKAFARQSTESGATAPGGDGGRAWRAELVETPGVASPNGNTVSLEDQMMRTIDAQQDHEAAIAIYRKTIDIMRMSLGRGV